MRTLRDFLGNLLGLLALLVMTDEQQDEWFDQIVSLSRPDMDDDAPHAAVRLACPECGEEIPLTLGTPSVEDGNLVVDFQMDDLWAHTWTHERAEEQP